MRNVRWSSVFVLFSTLVTFTAAAYSQIRRLDPPEKGFYAKAYDCGGISVKAAAVVEDQALLIACQKINMMLEHIPAARSNLAATGAELHIIGKSQATSDLPEYAFEKGKIFVDRQGRASKGDPTVDERTRGMGDVESSCGEENLLDLPRDRYRGRDICVHEFAHDIQNNGLPQNVRDMIRRQYERSLAQGLWRGSYALKNEGEYFAELSMWYFGTHGELSMEGQKPGNGREGLRQYDPDAYRLLDAIYSGQVPVHKIRTVSVQPIPAAEGKNLRSEPSNQKAELLIENKTDHDFGVRWIDPHGGVHSYGTLWPDQDRTFSTFAAHVWMLTDARGRPSVYIVVRAPRSRALVRQ